MSALLTADEVAELTGYKPNRYADQRRWLIARGWRFEVAITGRPVVARSFFESRMGAQESTTAAWQPNLAALKKRA